MDKIERNPVRASRDRYDLIIIGGGVYGIMLSMEAARRGLRSLLLEKDDFGGATSGNSLRIVHGGLRYLQTGDLKRFYESVGERSWFLKTFPYLVRPLPCLMPLYGKGLYRPSIFRCALWINDTLSSGRNSGLPLEKGIPDGMIVDSARTQKLFNGVDGGGLKGGAIWHDAIIPDPQRLLMDTIRWSGKHGSSFLNYVEAVDLIESEHGLEGITAIDHVGGDRFEFRSKIVINSSGPWARDLACRIDRDFPRLFRSSLAWNVLFDHKALSEHALAVSPRKEGSRIHFIVPWKGMLLAGTGHAPRDSSTGRPFPSEGELNEFIENLNLSVPGLDLRRDDVIHVYPGFLPVTEKGGVTLTTREVFIDHGEEGGPRGFYSLTGIKFTTSRLVAEKSLDRIFRHKGSKGGKVDREFTPAGRFLDGEGLNDFDWAPGSDNSKWKDPIRKIIEEESVCHLGDLIFRRTSMGDNPERGIRLAPQIIEMFDWDDTRKREEIQLLKDTVRV